jgi:hypothetical protein
MAQEAITNWEVLPDGNVEDNEVIEVWESMGGDLWFITGLDSDDAKLAFGYARLYAMPQFAEWGTIHRQTLIDDVTIWKVDRANWPNINTYEEGLLVKAE